MEHLHKAVSDIAMAQSEIGDAEQLKSARLKYGTAERAYIELHNSLIFLFPEEFTDTSVHISDWDLEDASARHQRMQVIIQEAMMIARKDIWANQR